MRAWRAGFPFTITVPAVGSMRSPMIRSSVDFPHPDGPISETNSPCSIVEVDALERGRRPPLSKTFDRRPVIGDDVRRAHTRFSGAPRTTIFSAISTMRKKLMPSAAAMTFVAHRSCRLDGVVLAVVDDLPSEPVLDRRRQLADDRADDARCRRHLQRGEDVRHRGRYAKLPEDAPIAGSVRVHQLECAADQPNAVRGWC